MRVLLTVTQCSTCHSVPQCNSILSECQYYHPNAMLSWFCCAQSQAHYWAGGAYIITSWLQTWSSSSVNSHALPKIDVKQSMVCDSQILLNSYDLHLPHLFHPVYVKCCVILRILTFWHRRDSTLEWHWYGRLSRILPPASLTWPKKVKGKGILLGRAPASPTVRRRISHLSLAIYRYRS